MASRVTQPIKQALILAGGLGTRLGEKTKDTPKPMLTVGGKPFLEYVIWNLKRHGVNQIILSVGTFWEKVADHFGDGSQFGVTIQYAVETEPAGTAGALLIAENKLDDAFFVLNGDTLFDANYLDLATTINDTQFLAGLALRSLPDAGRFGSVDFDGTKIHGFREKSQSAPGLVNGGIYVMRKSALSYIKKTPCSLETEVFPILAKEEKLAGKPFEGYFIDIGIPATLEQGNTELPNWQHKPAAFFDRDGVLNFDYCYVHKIEDFHWIDGAIDAIRYMNNLGYLTILITNQAGIGHGHYEEKDLLKLLDWMKIELALHGAHLDGIYYCPHHPSAKVPELKMECDCRKPNPGMIIRAKDDWNINMSKSFMIGDKDKDIQAAESAGIPGYLFHGGNLLDFLKSVI